MRKNLYRAISSEEKTDILQSKQFNIVDWGMEAKQFVLELSDAEFFKGWFKAECIVKVTIDEDYYNLLMELKQWIDNRWVVTIPEEKLGLFNEELIDIIFI